MSSEPYTVRWGILACGWIASVFSEDLLRDPATRNVHDVHHHIQAVASSTSVDKAKDFIAKVKAPSSTTAYGSYEELVADPNIDIIYVATPHSHHFQNCLLALNAGKNVLCEKPFTVNAPQLEILIKVAKEKGVFMMEAVWTRFFPLSREVRRLVAEGEIGDVKKVFAWLDLAQDPEEKYKDGKHRMVNPDLAGGALLDLGLYPLTWLFQTLYHPLPPSSQSSPKVTSSIVFHPPTGVDASNIVLLTFPSTGALGVASSGMHVSNDTSSLGLPCARILGTKGEITITHPAYCPTKFTVYKEGEEPVERVFPIPGAGMFWEADETARCLRDGKKECEVMPLAESLEVMRVMDSVRAQNGFRYPEEIESVEY
ncbi:NAD(P)-binding protein [Ascodesmis nigricans]|uniref:D-xylose 1-dehydrogenase (NADP(+), D-xylono-1,5-lactone-forming) n=1 Tax=Ascodesmis nigricans TaxID=341454 RepID=A0A4S2N4L9_9PEZI|nr:NAD(P)-binding protein [Ascodesmis nigricans]